MTSGDLILIDGQAFDVLRVDGPDRYYVGGPGRRRVLLWLDRGVWRYGRTGRIVEVKCV